MAASTANPKAPLRDALLLAAEQEVGEVGVGDVSLRAIARRVGVSHQAPGHHFGDRNGLFTALAAKGFRTLERRMLAARRRIPADATPAERVATLGVGYMVFARQHPALFSVMFRPELLDGDDEELAAARASAFAVLLDEVVAAGATGWGQHHSETALALTCWSTVHGAVTLWREGTLDTFFPDIGSVQTVARLVTETLNHGLAAEAVAPPPPPARRRASARRR
ncbi:TetR/AcrR family transcriptional regulator [Conexibacter woesei]|uniref:Transcriptional regulator, TetR family n=1 Tax=Conexibacter woesei (strain DSM 14684 / CCUG 47730 / CIP 108061 / JCM 11494 / NBRC 100937 / ID131577) TaxID=469383 RepID=D3EYX6_CONWI|nr:TetR/AcrR family transcriptional regulator [Conexibacter woesei]ADB49850.1 transcriptional regulator, TetR family [Conexibacter woesei DSM 14684]